MKICNTIFFETMQDVFSAVDDGKMVYYNDDGKFYPVKKEGKNYYVDYTMVLFLIDKTYSHDDFIVLP